MAVKPKPKPPHPLVGSGVLDRGLVQRQAIIVAVIASRRTNVGDLALMDEVENELAVELASVDLALIAADTVEGAKTKAAEKSAGGEGTTFHVRIPPATSTAAHPTPAASPTSILAA